MARVVWRRAALTDLTSIIAYIKQFDPNAAARYDLALRALGESLSEFPRRGRPAAGETREMTTVPPYVLGYRYRESDEQVDILLIRHGRQRPRT